MTADEIFDLFCDDLRKHPDAGPSRRVEYQDDVTLVTSARFRFVSRWTFDETSARDRVAALVSEPRLPGQTLIWRVYDRDGPTGLSSVLEAAGFLASSNGHLMVFDLGNDNPAVGTKGDVLVRPVETVEDFRHYEAVAAAAFEDDYASDEETMQASLADPNLTMFLAWFGGEPVGSCRMEHAHGRAFAGFLGGGVAPSARGRGVYSAMVVERLHQARQMGFRFACVDANGSSGPRLARLGFERIASETTWALGPSS